MSKLDKFLALPEDDSDSDDSEHSKSEQEAEEQEEEEEEAQAKGPAKKKAAIKLEVRLAWRAVQGWGSRVCRRRLSAMGCLGDTGSVRK